MDDFWISRVAVTSATPASLATARITPLSGYLYCYSSYQSLLNFKYVFICIVHSWVKLLFFKRKPFRFLFQSDRFYSWENFIRVRQLIWFNFILCKCSSSLETNSGLTVTTTFLLHKSKRLKSRFREKLKINYFFHCFKTNGNKK